MKLKSLSKDTAREFRKSFSRFLSITVIICLGVGFFSGMKAAAPTMKASAQESFDKGNMMDIELLSTIGFSAEDLDKVKDTEGVKEAYASYSVDVLAKLSGEKNFVCIKTTGYSDKNPINRPELIEGEYPENRGECAICAKSLNGYEYKVGDVLTLDATAGKTNISEVLCDMEYTVVGIIDSPMYFSHNYGTTSVGDGNVYAYMVIPEEEFLYARFTEIYVTLDIDRSEVKIYSDEYESMVSEVSEKLAPIGAESIKAFKEEAEKQISDSEEEFNKQKDDAYEKLDETKNQLDDAKNQLSDALRKLTDGWDKYNAGYDEYIEQISEAEAQLRAQKNLIADYKRQLAASEKEYNEAEAELKAAREKLDKGRAEYNKGLEDYNAGLNAYNDGIAQLANAKNQLDSAKAELDKARTALDAGWAEYYSGEEKYKESEETLNAGKDEYSENLNTLDEMKAEYTAGTWNDSGSTCNEILRANVTDELWIILNRPTALAQLSKKLAVAGVISVYEIKLAEAKEQIDRGEEELAQAKSALDEAKKQLEDGEAEYISGKKQYDEGLAKYNKEYAESTEKLADAKVRLESAKQTLQSSLTQLNKGEAEYKEGQEKLAAAQARLADAKKQIADGEGQISDGEKKIESSKTAASEKFDVSKKELEDAQKKYDDGKKEYDEGLEQYENAKKDAELKLAEGAAQIQNAKSAFVELDDGKWYIFNRNDVVWNYSGLGQDADRIDAISGLFPAFFLIVAALVCVTTMTRMVEEQRSQMGAYKALGYSKIHILSKYLKYALAAGLAGGVTGQLICVQLFPGIIMKAYEMMYDFGKVKIVVPWHMLGISLLAGIGCTAFVAFLCCHKEVKTAAAQLMRPRAPKAGKKILLERIPFIWNSFNFSFKITLRNLFRYKVRFLMTVVGITGCMALIVSGFGLKNAIDPIVNLQYEKISDYDVIISLYEPYSEAQAEECKREMTANDQSIDRLLFAKQLDITAKSESVPDEPMSHSYLFVPQNITDFEALQHLIDADTGETVKLSDGEAVITGKMAKTLSIDVGDRVTFTYDNTDYSVKVSGIVENYVYHYIYITPDTYKELFGDELTFNSLFASTLDGEVDSEEILLRNSNFLTATKISYICQTMDENFKSLYLVIAVLIVAASALAVVVLYNLTNINISERVREIATMKVLGFKREETDMYVFRENIIMTVIGIVFGNICGYMLCRLIINMVEVDMVVFSRVIQPASYIYSTLITVAITFAVFLLMKSKIRKIDMVEALKSVE
ncbi:MAG: FtsX-like permease family protein [Clostridia bacterium]|nr:FtsX-like permease family protein [Clostridia bacterium]